MEFKTKDLLVTVLPKPELANKDIARACLWGTRICVSPTLPCLNQTRICGTQSLCLRASLTCDLRVSLCNPCTLFVSGCGVLCSVHTGGCGTFNSCGGPGGSACDPTYYCIASIDPYVIQHQEDLVVLKAVLQDTLKSLDALQKEGLPSMIGSKTEAEALERGLTAALEQVRAAKKNL